MDHDDCHDHGDDSSTTKKCPMIMVFHGGHCERILWKGWVASTVVEFVFSALALFLMAFLYEALKFLRQYLLRRAAKQEAERNALEIQIKTGRAGPAVGGCSNTPLAEIKEKSYLENITGSAHLIQTLLNVVQIVISYLLMLVFMNYNYWLCLAMILGLGLGYFFFGWIKKDAYDNECCH